VKTYRVIRDCIGFKKRRWTAGEIVELDDNDNPPRHFERVDAGVKPEVTEEPGLEHIAFSQIHNKPKVTHGFAYKAEEAHAKTPKTAGMTEPS